ncbi:hypothetical protein DPMN_159640 [Dreissena polymorpha]|uniref:Reverse transcriptase zinc-binding domain-containing protein n=1 Tax=Dreissena polymorpha TaxID=45954 RepID=A0A9D4ENN7_DREPO|nr:hypothetical protein DPMN_159640 [Dreissena polymorpha]
MSTVASLSFTAVHYIEYIPWLMYVDARTTTLLGECGSLKLHSTLTFLRDEVFRQGKVLPIFAPEFTSGDSGRMKVKLRLAAGTYYLQSTRKNFNQYDIDLTCQLCQQEIETTSHFLIECSLLNSVRESVLPDIALQRKYISKQ